MAKKGSKFFTFILNAFWRALWVVNLFLTISASVGAFLFLLLWTYGGIPLPAFLESHLKSELEEQGVIVENEGVFFLLSGGVRIDSPSMRFVGTPENFFKASKIELSLWTSSLLYGDFRVKGIAISNGSVGRSYTNLETDAVLRNIHGVVSKSGAWWNLDTLTFRAGKLLVSTSGSVNEDFNFDKFIAEFESIGDNLISLLDESFKKAEKKPKDPSRPLSAKLDEVLEQFPTFEKYSNMFSDSDLGLIFILSPNGGNKIKVSLRSGEALLDIDSVKTRAKNMLLKLVCESVGTRHERIATYFTADELSIDSYTKIENINLCADLSPRDDVFALENIDVWAQKVQLENIVLDDISLRKSFLDFRKWGEDWWLYLASGDARFGARIDIEKNFSVSADFSGNIDPTMFFGLNALKDIPELKEFAFPDGLWLAGKVAYDIEKNIATLSANIEASNFVAMGIPVDFCMAQANFDGEVLDISNISIKTMEGWGMKGAFTQNIVNYDYTVRACGLIRPMAIASFMEVWWTKVMSSFSFVGDGNFPYGDVWVKGRWGKPEFIWCYADASGKNALYNGVNFSNFHVNVWVNPQRITLYDLSVGAQTRTAHGLIEWLYGKEGITTYKKQRIFLESNLNSQELIALGGSDAKEVLDVVKFAQAPRLTLNAELFNPSLNPDRRDIFNVSAFASGDTTIEGITIKNFGFNAKSDKINTQINDATFVFCRGNAGGSVSLHKRSDGGMNFKADINAENMNQADFINFLASLGKSKKDDSTKASDFLEGSENGVVNAAINFGGDLQKMEMSVGNGYVSIENKDLKSLHIFGLLSRALSSLKLPLGSFDITYLSTPFSIAAGEVEFPRLEMGGPVMRAQGAISYDFLKDDLDGALMFTLFGGLDVPILSEVVSLIDPITSSVQINVDGSLADPSFGVSLKPANVLRSDKKIVEKIRDSL